MNLPIIPNRRQMQVRSAQKMMKTVDSAAESQENKKDFADEMHEISENILVFLIRFASQEERDSIELV